MKLFAKFDVPMKELAPRASTGPDPSQVQSSAAVAAKMPRS